jgi:hypothetical protein
VPASALSSMHAKAQGFDTEAVAYEFLAGWVPKSIEIINVETKSLLKAGSKEILVCGNSM